MSLEAYVERVLAQGLEARAAAASAEVAAAELQAVGLWPNASVEVSRAANVVGARAGESQDQLLVSVPLALSGRLGLARDAAGKELDAAQARLSFARGHLRRAATAAFLGVAAARQRLAVEQAALIALEPIAGAIAAREQAGASAGYDRVRIDLERRQLEVAVGAAMADVDLALAGARALLPPGDGAARFVELDLTHALPAAASPSGAHARGDVRALEAEAEAAKLEEAAAWRALIPEPTVTGGGYLVDVGGPALGVGYGVGVAIPVPLLDHGQGGRARARARRLRAEAERAALAHAAEVRWSAASAEQRARAARARKHDADVVGRADELVTIVEAAYRGGAVDLLALVDATGAQRDAHLAAVELHLAARLADNDVLLLSGAYDDAPSASTTP